MMTDNQEKYISYSPDAPTSLGETDYSWSAMEEWSSNAIEHWFSDKAKNAALHALERTGRPADDDQMAKLLRAAKELCYLRGCGTGPSAKELGMSRPDARGVLDACPEDIKMALIEEAANMRDPRRNKASNPIADHLCKEIEQTLRAELPGLGSAEEETIRRVVNERIRKARERIGSNADIAEPEILESIRNEATTAARRRINKHRIDEQLVEIAASDRFAVEVVNLVRRSTKRKAFDLTKFGDLENVFTREQMRVTEPADIEAGIGFLDARLAAELRVVRNYLYMNGDSVASWVIQKTIVENSDLIAIADHATGELLDAADQRLIDHWLGLDQTQSATKFDPDSLAESDKRVETYARRVFKSVLVEWIPDQSTFAIEPPAGSSSTDGSLDPEPPAREPDPGVLAIQNINLMTAEAVLMFDDLIRTIGRAGIELAGVIDDLPNRIHWKSLGAAESVMQLSLITLEIHRRALVEARATLRSQVTADDASSVASESLRLLHPGKRTALEHEYLVFEAFKEMWPTWNVRYDDRIPTQKSSLPGAEDATEGSDYQTLHRRACGHSDGRNPLVLAGVAGLLSGIYADLARIIDDYEERLS